MCGICGVVGGDRDREVDNVKRMTSALAHRGPDDEGICADGDAVLGHRRLTIIDLERGRQPLPNEDGSLWITFNGEIYNYSELRAELVAAGHRFRTKTDTEVILHLFEEYGPRCLERLRGMFAFAIWDGKRRSLFAARDRFGQKPFYYAILGNRFLFSSEVKGLLAHPDLAVEPEPAAIDYYLALRFVPPPLTMFRGIKKLAAGQYLTFADGELGLESYWQLRFSEGDRRPESDWISELTWRLGEAVGSHMMSDVPVGAFLSGGMDSSVIVAAMAHHASAPVQTFSIGSDVSSFDETPFARAVARYCGTNHRERYVDSGRLQSLPRLVAAMDEPSDPIAACMYEVAKFASEHVKVVLGGDGGDELLGGFDRYVGYRWVGYYQLLPRWLREDVVAPLIRRLPESFAYKSVSQRARWLDALGGEPEGRRYARMTSFFRFGPAERRWLYGSGLLEMLEDQQAEDAIAEPFSRAPAECDLNRMLYADSVTRLPEHTLMLTDRMSMAHGLETRAPLLDHRLAEFCASMPSELKIRRGVTKYAMRRATGAWLPDEILRRRKQGFMFPVAYWLDAEILPAIAERLKTGPLVERAWIRPAAVNRLLGEHLKRRVDHHVRIWMLLNLDVWYRLYVEGKSVEDPPLAPEVATYTLR